MGNMVGSCQVSIGLSQTIIPVPGEFSLMSSITCTISTMNESTDIPIANPL